MWLPSRRRRFRGAPKRPSKSASLFGTNQQRSPSLSQTLTSRARSGQFGATETRMPYYLGLDSSTQSLSAMAIDPEQGRVVLDQSVNFGRDLPEYASPHGFLEHENPNVKHSNPLMWVEALDLLLSRVRATGFDFGQ